jgi:hypothetical protein
MSGGSCACGGSCGCGHSHGHDQAEVYLTREEYVARLEQYLIDLKNEIKAVEEELAAMRQAA